MLSYVIKKKLKIRIQMHSVKVKKGILKKALIANEFAVLTSTTYNLSLNFLVFNFGILNV